MKYMGRWMVLAIASTILAAASCNKEKPTPPIPGEPKLWEKFIGSYKVYDTTGIYLYEMEISRSEFDYPTGGKGNLIHIQNFDNNFNLSFAYDNQIPNDFLPIGFHDPISGINDGKTWQIYGQGGENKNRLINDTLYLAFEKTNIQYYLQELTPYYHCYCEQIAVKQH